MDESHSEQLLDYSDAVRRIISASRSSVDYSDRFYQRDLPITTDNNSWQDKVAALQRSSKASPTSPLVVGGSQKDDTADGYLTSSMLELANSMIHQPRQSPVVEILSQARLEIEKNRQEIDLLRVSLSMKDKRMTSLEHELDASRQLAASLTDQLKARIQAESPGASHSAALLAYSFNMQTAEPTTLDVSLQADIPSNSTNQKEIEKVQARLEQITSEYEALKMEHEDFQLRLASTKSENEFTSFKALLEYNQLKTAHENALTQINAVETENSLMDHQVKELTSQIEMLKTENSTLLSRVSALEAEALSMQTKYDSVKEQSSILCTESKKVEELLKQRINNCLDELVTVRAENAEQSNRLDEYTNAYMRKSEELTIEIQKYKSLLQEASASNEQLTKHCKDLEERLAEQQDAHASASNAINTALIDAQKNKEALENEITDIRATLNQAMNTVEVLKTENASLRKATEKSNSSIAARMDAAISASKASFELRIAQLERELEGARSETSVTNIKLATQTALVSQSQKEVDILKISLATAENTISTLQQTLSTYTEEGNFKQQSNASSEQNMKLAEKVKELEIELDKRKAREHALSKDLEFLRESADNLARKCERRGSAKVELQAALKERDIQLSEKTIELETQKSEFSAQLASLEARIQSDGELLRKLRLEKEELTTQIDTLKHETIRLQADLDKKDVQTEQIRANTTNAINSISAENKSLLLRLEQATDETSRLQLTNQRTTMDIMRLKQEAEQLKQENSGLRAELQEALAKKNKAEAQANADIDALTARINEMVSERDAYEKERQELMTMLEDKESSLDAAQITISSQINHKKIAESLCTENSALRLELEQIRLNFEQLISESRRQNEELLHKNHSTQRALNEKISALDITVGLLKEGKDTVQQLQQEKDMLIKKIAEQQGLLGSLQSKLVAKDAEHASKLLQLELQTQEYATELRQLTDLHNNYRKSIEVGDIAVAEKLNALAEINKEMQRSSHNKTPISFSVVDNIKGDSLGRSTRTPLTSNISNKLGLSGVGGRSFRIKEKSASASSNWDATASIDEEVMRLTMLREELQRSMQGDRYLTKYTK